MATTYVSYLIRAASALILAIVFLRTYGRFHKGYILHWTWSWLALSIHYGASAAVLSMIERIGLTHPFRMGFSALAGAAAYLQVGFLLFGAWELLKRRPVKLRTVRYATPLLAIAGILPTLMFLEDSGSGAERMFLRVGLYGFVGGWAFLVAGWAMWRSRREKREFGVSLMSMAFFLYAIQQFHYFVITIPAVREAAPTNYSAYLGHFDVVFLMLMGLGMLAALLEQEQEAQSLALDEIEHLAYHDPLTGLPNRPLLLDRLIVALARAKRTDRRIAVFFIDLDRFKEINDSLGHTAGDSLLKLVADRLNGLMRQQDTLARFGSDEFALIVHDLDQVEHAAHLAQRYLDTIRLPYIVNEVEIFVSSSIGISFFPDDGTDAETLIRNADTAMNRAKEEGRDSYRIYSAEMNMRALERLGLENLLRHAIEQDELVLHYQPLIDLDSLRVFGVEALLRWKHPQEGLLLPVDFIHVAEISGLILPIGRWVLEKACGDLERLQREIDSDFLMSINLSTRQFRQHDLVETIRAAVERFGITAGTLQVEITETNAMDDAERTVAILAELRTVGVGISVDDFGTGYSSLEYLKRFPIDTLKLDRAFVEEIASDPGDDAIATAVIAMAHSLGLKVVAEGVENRAQLELLKSKGCDRIQGHLFSAALDIEELLRFLDENRMVAKLA